MKLRFTKNYNHKWPSRAVTFYPAGYCGTVKREVADAALAKGVASVIGKRKASLYGLEKDAPADMAGIDDVAGTDSADDSGPSVQLQRPASGDE